MSEGQPLALVLFGVSGCGKTTVGKLLAPALGATFLEGDDYHPPENVAKMHAGTALEDTERWPWIATLGRAIAGESSAERPAVIACSALRHAYREALAEAARRPLTFVHLVIDPAVLEIRVRVRRHFMAASLLGSQLGTLEPLHIDEDGTAIVETGSPQETVEAIMCWLLLERRIGPNIGTKKGRLHRPVGTG